MTPKAEFKDTSAIQITSKRIAYALIFLFSLCLLLVLFKATAGDHDERWYELFKEGFLFLSGALTTVIGYYFGSRGTQEAEASAAIALREAKELKKQNEKERSELEELRAFIEDQAPTKTEDDLTDETLPPLEEPRT